MIADYKTIEVGYGCALNALLNTSFQQTVRKEVVFVCNLRYFTLNTSTTQLERSN